MRPRAPSVRGIAAGTARAALWLATLLLATPLGIVALARPSWRRGLSQRVFAPPRRHDRPVWVHTASVGEAAAAAPLVEALVARGVPVHVTSQTWTGRERLAALHAGLAPRLAPLDHPLCTRRALRRLAPRALVLVETEIWPSLVAQADGLEVPIVVVSGRISERAHRRRRELDLFGVSRRSFARLRAVGARSEDDARRFVELGCDPARVTVTGDLKWAKPASKTGLAPELAAWLARRPTIVLGSTHAGEVPELLRAVEHVRCARPGLQWLWAPRHVDECEALLRRLAGVEIIAMRRSDLGGIGHAPGSDGTPIRAAGREEATARRRDAAEVLVLDSLGELAAAWPHGLLAVVGGSFDDTGGHDLLEPVHAGRPLLFGPRVHSTQETARALLAARAAIQTPDGAELGRQIVRLLGETSERAALAERATGVARRFGDALDANLRLVLDHAGAARATVRPKADALPELPSGLYARTPISRSRVVRAALRTAAGVYGFGARLDRTLHARGLLRRRRLPCVVVSVGSLAAGGAGKTPAAAWIARTLHERGHRVVLAARGHGVRLGGEVRVASHGTGECAAAGRVGDEARVLARRAPGVPVVVGRDRFLAGLRAVTDFDCSVLVLDDGFQHHRLQRDLDLVCLDGRIGLAGGRVLPFGPLREPVAALARADALLVVDGPLGEVDAARVEDVARAARRFTARRVPRRWVRLGSGQTAEPAALAGREVGMLAGLAEPSGFRALLGRLGVEVVAARLVPDHHPYRARELADLEHTRQTWVTTEKDAVKIDPAWLPESVELWVLEIELVPDRPEAFVRHLESRIERARARWEGIAPSPATRAQSTPAGGSKWARAGSS